MAQPHDPKWQRFSAGYDSNLVGLGRSGPPTIGVGAYICSDCTRPHVVIAAILHDLELDMFLSAATAREIAAALIERANEVDNGGLN